MHKIIIIDDEVELLNTVKELIEIRFTCDIDTATNGLDGFLMLQKEKYDIIITDHKMPYMTGAALIIATRTKETANKQTPIIMLSGFIDESMKKNLKIQNVQFLNKPFANDDLFNMIRDELL